MNARRRAVDQAPTSQSDNPGLLLSSYLAHHDEKAKRVLLSEAIQASRRIKPIYSKAYSRWKASLPPGTLTAIVRTKGRFVTGLGAAGPLDIGIRLHHTYGTPFLPGSGLKGLCAHYCDRVWGTEGSYFKKGSKQDVDAESKSAYEQIFGTTESAGLLIFQDAWAVPDSLTHPNGGLVLDVMTPHHTKYGTNPDEPPSDFDSPIPIPFLSYSGKLLIAISPNGEGQSSGQWMRLALELAKHALGSWGAGAKTRSGYGRFSMSEIQ